ncbi:bifunctional biotin--[acetyl-CoA-carboxylase] ligase/biotin operon repressor BirA [Aliidiomarina sp. Khilg15.8]
MKRKTQEIENTLIERLADGQFHSGQRLAEDLQISRTAVNKRIASLEQLDLDIFRVHGKGYRLAQPLQLLDAETLRRDLTDASNVHMRRVTTSTHDDLKTLLHESGDRPLPAGTAVIAEMQTAGRGRRGKTWLSPFGSNLYMSMYWPLHNGLNGALGLSVMMGIQLARMMQEQGIADVSVKWPNDVYIGGAKVAGILIELEGQPMGEGHALIGIGLNLSMPARYKSTIDQPYTDIQSHLNGPLVRHEWAAQLVNSCRAGLQSFETSGLADYLDDWVKLDHFYQQPVRVLLGNHEQRGVAEGVDENGALLVRQDGVVKRYFGGEISIRAVK